MSETRTISQLFASAKPGDEVTLRGWIYRTRSSGAIVFTVLRDQSGVVQVTVKKGNVPDPDLDAADVGEIYGIYLVPGAVQPTQFPVVDVSVQRADGVPTHSGISVVRGTLPPVTS